MKRSEIVFGVLRVPADAAAVAGALMLAYFLRTRNIDLLPGAQILEPAKTLPGVSYYASRFVLTSSMLYVLIASVLKLYLIRVTLGFFREIARVILAAIVWVALITGWYFFVEKQLFFSRAILLHGAAFVAVFACAGRTALTLVQRALLKRGIGVRSVLSIGTQPPPEHVEEFLARDPRYRYLGHASSVRPDVDLILQTDPSTSDETNRIIDFCRSRHIGYAFLPPVLIDVPHLLRVHRFGSVPVLRFHPTPLDGWGAVYKRGMDVILSILFLIILSPLILSLVIAIKLDSRGPAFYRSRRMGRMFQYINIWKHRSMVEDADSLKEELRERSHRDDGPLFKIRDDPRVTRVGRSLRRFSLDELPQLWSVLRGDLSLVGPRPHLPEEVERYTDFQKRVFAVKPGMTGLAQISGRSDLPFSEEVRLDLQYIEEWSPWLDLWILWRTIWVVFRGNGAD